MSDDDQIRPAKMTREEAIRWQAEGRAEMERWPYRIREALYDIRCQPGDTLVIRLAGDHTFAEEIDHASEELNRKGVLLVVIPPDAEAEVGPAGSAVAMLGGENQRLHEALEAARGMAVVERVAAGGSA